MTFTPKQSALCPPERTLDPPRVLNIREPGAVKDERPNGLYIGRAMKKCSQPGGNFIPALPASEWENPHKITADTPAERAAAVRKYIVGVLEDAKRRRIGELAGQSLICWCSPKLCHGNALAELVALTKFYGGKCPHCESPVDSFLNWHEGLFVMAEAWVCRRRSCERWGEARRPVPSCLLREQPLLL
jgi:hypothetical protein